MPHPYLLHYLKNSTRYSVALVLIPVNYLHTFTAIDLSYQKKKKKIKYCNTISAKDKNMTLMCSVGIRLITHLYVTAIIILLYTEIYSCFTRTYADGVQLAYSIHDTGMPGSLRVAVSFNL